MTPENNEQLIDFNIGSKEDWERGRERGGEGGRKREEEGRREGGRGRKGGRRHVCMYMYSTLLTISASLIAASSSLPIIIK